MTVCRIGGMLGSLKVFRALLIVILIPGISDYVWPVI
jgi:hypothetical protein